MELTTLSIISVSIVVGVAALWFLRGRKQSGKKIGKKPGIHNASVLISESRCVSWVPTGYARHRQNNGGQFVFIAPQRPPSSLPRSLLSAPIPEQVDEGAPPEGWLFIRFYGGRKLLSKGHKFSRRFCHVDVHNSSFLMKRFPDEEKAPEVFELTDCTVETQPLDDKYLSGLEVNGSSLLLVTIAHPTRKKKHAFAAPRRQVESEWLPWLRAAAGNIESRRALIDAQKLGADNRRSNEEPGILHSSAGLPSAPLRQHVDVDWSPSGIGPKICSTPTPGKTMNSTLDKTSKHVVSF